MTHTGDMTKPPEPDRQEPTHLLAFQGRVIARTRKGKVVEVLVDLTPVEWAQCLHDVWSVEKERQLTMGRTARE